MGRSIQVQVAQVGASTSEATARTHTLLVDRPVDKGGADKGPLGGELLLIALGGCFMSTLLAAIRTRNADVSDVVVAVSGMIDGAPERFERLSMQVTARYESDALMEKLIAIAERGCLVTNTLKPAAPITVTFERPSGRSPGP